MGKKETESANDNGSTSWFVVYDNPNLHGYPGTPEEVCQKLRDAWITGSGTKKGYWAYCRSAKGLEHVHMVLEDNKTMRFSAIKKVYPSAHIEITRGGKAQVEAYINKDPPFDEKGEEVLYSLMHGDVHGSRQGQRSDLSNIVQLLDNGMTPAEVMRQRMQNRRYEKMIKAEFFDRRLRYTPIIRDVMVHWLVGDSGTGKSYTLLELAREHGEENIYRMTDYENGGLDMYEAQPILFMDEYRGQLPYSQLLVILDRYKSQVHSRYVNTWTLWNTVYIASVLPPEEVYRLSVPPERRSQDSEEQLYRRVTDITYYYRDKAGEYKTFTLNMSAYTDYEDLRRLARRVDRDCPFN